MEEFDRLFDASLKISDSKEYNDIKQYLYIKGMEFLSNGNFIPPMKESIICKLLYLFPEDCKLYYEMGRFYRQDDIVKCIMWHKMCYQMNPQFMDNTNALIKVFYDIKEIDAIFQLNTNNIFEKFLNNKQFLFIFARCNFIQQKYEKGIDYLIKLIKYSSIEKCKSMEDKINMWSNYQDAGYIYSALCDYSNSIKYTNDALELADKFNLDIQRKMLSYQNLLSFSDFTYSDNEEVFKKYLKMNEYYPNQLPFSFLNRKRNNKIRIGYVSSDFINMHPVSNFLLPILNNHNRERFDIYIFPTISNIDNEFSKLGNKIFSIDKMTDKAAAELINSKEIDILFELNGHTVNNRIGVFSFNPAPIQISYLGYPNTTGLNAIKYRLTDSVADSENTKQKYTEKLIRLPKCFLLYKSTHQTKPVIPKKTMETIILGAINKENKNSITVLETWKKILAKIPKCKILIKLESFDNIEERRKYYKNKLNIEDSILITVARLKNEEYIKLFTMIDILLDTSPYSGTTTTCNALYNSIPVITLYNENIHCHNVSSSILINMGNPELVAYSEEEYIEKTIQLVNSPEKIENYKKSLNKNFNKLMEPKEFMKSYENTLEELYNKPVNVEEKISISL